MKNPLETSTSTWILASAICSIGFLLYVYMANSPWRKLRARLPGPRSYPLVGAGLSFIAAKNEDMLIIGASFVRNYGWRYTIPIGPEVYVALYDADGIEKLLSSSTHITKGDIYKLLGNWLGEGLLTSTDRKWHQRRKLLTPAFHFRILDDFMKIFNSQTRLFIRTLKKDFGDGEALDIFPYITRVTLDVICETAMGVKLNAQTERDTPYVRAVYSMCGVLQFRFFRPWYYPNFIWRLTRNGKTEAASLNTILGFTKSVIAKRKLERKSNSVKKSALQGVRPEEDDVYFGQRKRLAFLDMLLEAQENPENMLSDEDIREEVDTFMFEVEKARNAGTRHHGGQHRMDDVLVGILYRTPSMKLAYNMFRINEKVREELQHIFGTDADRDVTSEDLSKMKYLDMCIKESLRLYPSVPFLARKLCTDFDVGDVVIPKGANVFTMPYFCHRNPVHFPDPENFDPLRFSPENSAGRHPYAYIPFSAGPRNCIGQKFALMEEKIILANIFRNFRVQAACDIKDIVVMSEIITRPKDGFPVKLISLKYVR